MIIYELDANASSGRTDIGTMKEIRPGRNIFCRTVTCTASNVQEEDVGSSSSPSSNETEIRTHQHQQLHILFVHGSCAASSQFDALISHLSDTIESGNGDGDDDDDGDGDGDSSRDSLKKISSMHCYLYDQLGCARSSQHPTSDWNAYSSEEHLHDLQAITQSILKQQIQQQTTDEGTGTGTGKKEEESPSSSSNVAPFYIVAHSYGVSQTIKLVVNALSPAEASRINGLILIGGALKDGPASDRTRDGGHWIFRYVPMFMLRQMQPALSKGFVDAAVHPNNVERLRQSGTLDISDRNDMAVCKAFYRQQKYASVAEASKVKTKSLIIHGKDDLMFPLSAGEHLYKSIETSEIVVIPEASHQVFEEKAKEVADEIMKFITDSL